MPITPTGFSTPDGSITLADGGISTGIAGGSSTVYATVSDGTISADYEDADPFVSIQGAITALEADTPDGGVILVHPGNYVFTSNDIIQILKPNIHIIGSGWETQIKKDLVGTNVHLVNMFSIGNSASGCSIQNMQLDYNTNNNAIATGLITISNSLTAEGFLIKGVRFVGSTYNNQNYISYGKYTVVDGCHFNFSAASNLGRCWQQPAQYSTIKNCVVEDNGNMKTFVNTGVNSSYLTIEDNVIYQSTIERVLHSEAVGVRNVIFRRNKVYSTTYSFMIYNASDASFIDICDNEIYGGTGSFITYAFPYAISGDTTFENVKISGNKVFGPQFLSVGISVTANHQFNFKNVNVSGNTISNDSSSNAIEFHFGGNNGDLDVDTITIENNSIEQNTSSDAILFKTYYENVSANNVVLDISGISICDNNISHTSTGDGISMELNSYNSGGANLDVTWESMAIENNTIVMTNAGAGHGVKLFNQTESNLTSLSLDNFNVSNNTIQSAGTTSRGIWFDLGEEIGPVGKAAVCENFSFDGNTIDCVSSSNPGIVIDDTISYGSSVTYLTINSNTIKVAASSGILLSPTITDIIINSNIIKSTSIGINLSTNVSAAVISGNNIKTGGANALYYGAAAFAAGSNEPANSLWQNLNIAA